ncbi:tRNA (adenosine(37)-N6)-threonylcarbamoyltransferase complex dimerization subunit type 1 TsaB [Dolichospermum sp. UHCC 0259]|uniref:tRNA (adenosine(37)-N6)-threonylcarbamoyltransferase complex dimerization subunit type 1 TsaB n=1 Tax=Dolichospermum sp. UHCC 0259 TaxID=2590010 RepID=UPI0014462D92|nr:tRNA (adenosine(37)-N6)-threonylcarbamoyltransferase complex dimerization subunit type 1 TsaB [Dolichospermum sp. UHCC 0259]MTJ47888.1 tRNA (adenosine(37)-N6)-threonylcarbamoyltransferase complex dimerization subunit type 1 TsaB [Dolichospermum sp. UHCC 0259]
MTTIIKHLSPDKYALALHTTTPELGLAISNFANYPQSQVWNLGRDLSSHIHQYLVEIIKPRTWADLEFIAVAQGPGGFTGTRIGVVTARTLAQQLNIPAFTISTLAALAWQAHKAQKNCQHPIIALEMPAQRGQIFGAIYQVNPNNAGITALLSDTVFTPSAWKETLTNWHTNQLISATSHLAVTVNSILELAYLDWQHGKNPHWSEALPYYGQHPVDI